MCCSNACSVVQGVAGGTNAYVGGAIIERYAWCHRTSDRVSRPSRWAGGFRCLTMECPRCGDELVVLTLGDARTVTCETCQYAGVPTEFRPPPADSSESWEEALARFFDEQA